MESLRELLQEGGETVVEVMHALVTQIQQEKEIPKHWAKSTDVPIYIDRPSHLQMPGGPKMARAALSRRAIDGTFAVV